ncbi:hypothetical protein [Microbacterium sp.]|uniref:hypothetical protein n=1 Tax=Microbacterium sp. TaxID=51671 RepID=UPI003241ECE7
MADTLTPSLRPDGWTDADLAYRPEVMANAPAWCNHVDVSFESDGSIGIGYNFRHGSVEIGTAAFGDNGIVTPADDGAVFLFFTDSEEVTAAILRRYAADFLAAADALENGLKR